MREMGRRVGAVDIAITHNSLTVNLARLDEAHLHVGTLYPEERPIRTTCGTVTGKREWRDLPLLRTQRWRRTWLRQSASAARVRAAIDQRVVIADIAHEVDLVGFSAIDPLHLRQRRSDRDLLARGRRHSRARTPRTACSGPRPPTLTPSPTSSRHWANATTCW